VRLGLGLHHLSQLPPLRLADAKTGSEVAASWIEWIEIAGLTASTAATAGGVAGVVVLSLMRIVIVMAVVRGDLPRGVVLPGSVRLPVLLMLLLMMMKLLILVILLLSTMVLIDLRLQRRG
jgi:hypothetical protein